MTTTRTAIIPICINLAYISIRCYSQDNARRAVPHVANRIRIECERDFTVCRASTPPVFTARCYASAVLAMGLCLSVSVSVCHKSEFY